MIPRELEPETMDAAEDVEQYDAMDNSEVNARFVGDFLAAHGPCRGGEVLDVGAGTGLIPIALARADAAARVVAFDLAPAMVERARRNVASVGLSDRVRCLLADAKSSAKAIGAASFEAVVSNSIVHHIADPGPALALMVERVAPGGTLMVRDLFRPDSEAELDELVARHAADESPGARALFRASLHAAFTVDEVQALAVRVGLPASCVAATSDRHWTLIWNRPA